MSVNLPGSYLVLELSNHCPLNCGHCAVSEAAAGHPHYEHLGHMPPGMVRELLVDLRAAGLRFDNLVLFWLGEPLSHPDFLAIYRMLLDHTGAGEVFGKIEVHTNALPLTEDIAAAVCNDRDVPQVWHLTLDAQREDTFVHIKGRRGLEQSQRRAKRLLAAKGAAGTRWPRLAVQFIVSHLNVGEAEEFVGWWRDAFAEYDLPVDVTGFHVPAHADTDFIYLKSLDCPTPQEQRYQNRIYGELMARLGLASPVDPAASERAAGPVGGRLLNACSGWFKSPTIAADGRVTVCTRDSTWHLALGSLQDSSFSQLWLHNPWLNRQRQRVARGDYDELPFCQTCFIPSSVNYSEISAAELASFLAAVELDGPDLPPAEPSRHARPFPDDYRSPRETSYNADPTAWSEP